MHFGQLDAIIKRMLGYSRDTVGQLYALERLAAVKRARIKRLHYGVRRYANIGQALTALERAIAQILKPVAQVNALELFTSEKCIRPDYLYR